MLGALWDEVVVVVEGGGEEAVAGVLLVLMLVAGQPVVAVLGVLDGAEPASTVASV